MRQRMDAAGAVDAQNAPTAPWKTAQNAVSHSAHTHHPLAWREEGRSRLTHRIPDTPRQTHEIIALTIGHKLRGLRDQLRIELIR